MGHGAHLIPQLSAFTIVKFAPCRVTQPVDVAYRRIVTNGFLSLHSDNHSCHSTETRVAGSELAIKRPRLDGSRFLSSNPEKEERSRRSVRHDSTGWPWFPCCSK